MGKRDERAEEDGSESEARNSNSSGSRIVNRQERWTGGGGGEKGDAVTNQGVKTEEKLVFEGQ